MNKVLKGLVAVAASAAMAVAGMFGAGTAMAANTYQITVPAEDTHTYSVYQIFTGSLSTDGTLGDVTAGKNFNENNGAGEGNANLTAAKLPSRSLRLRALLMTLRSWQPFPSSLI